MEIDDEGELLKKISTFIINRKSDELRDEIYEFIVGLILYDNPDGLTLKEIHSNVIKELNVDDISINFIENCIEKLIKENLILSLKKNQVIYYFLTDSSMNKYKIYSSYYDDILKKVDEKIIFMIISQIVDVSENETNYILNKFKEFIKIMFSKLSIEACSEIIKGNRLLVHESYKSIIYILNEIVNDMNINVDKNKIKTLYKYIINEDDEIIKEYLFFMAQSYFIVHILRLDPVLETYTKDLIAKRTVYLDTNIIMNSQIGKRKKRSSAVNALKLTYKLGINMKYTNETKNEYLRVLENKKKDFHKADYVPVKRYQKISEYIEEGMLRDYMDIKKETPDITIDAYFVKLAGFEIITKSRYGVEFDANNYYDIYEIDNFDNFIEIVKIAGFSSALFKSHNVAKHDAFHLLLIKKLREMDEGDIFGPKYWFLTQDYTLQNAEKKFYDPEMYSSITADKWVQIITPLLSPENMQNAKEAYLGLLSSRLPISVQVIDEDDFLLLQGKWIDDEELSPINVAKILGNEWLKSYTTELREEDREIEKEELLKALEPIIASTKEHDEAIKQLDKKIEELSAEKEEISAEKEEIKKESNVYKNRYEVTKDTLGGIFFILIFYLVFNYLILHLDPWQAFIGAVIISLILGSLLGFKGFKWLIEKINISNTFSTKK